MGRSDMGPVGRGYIFIDFRNKCGCSHFPSQKRCVSSLLEASEGRNLHAWSPSYRYRHLLGTQGPLEETASLLPH